MLGPYSKKHWKLWLKNGAGATVAGPSTEQIDKLQGFLLCNGVYAKPVGFGLVSWGPYVILTCYNRVMSIFLNFEKKKNNSFFRGALLYI